MSRECEVVVVGAGIVGLASAAALARAGRSVVVLEREPEVARGITSRSSQVVHASLYDPEGSLKATLCARGRELLYERCERLRLPHRRLGKLVVAVEEAEREPLLRLFERGTRNGASGLELLDRAGVRRLEPAVHAVAAVLSPDSGIVDARGLALSYAAELEAHGGAVALGAELETLERSGGRHRLRVARRDGSTETLSCDAVVNAAGLGAERVARLAGIDTAARGLRLRPCKGDYFALAPRAPLRLSRLVYPVSDGPGLGIHATLDLGGRIRFGPDAEYVDAPSYTVDPGKATIFAADVRPWLPGFDAAWLTPDQAGVRPKLAGPDDAFRDFVIAEESASGLPGLVNLVGIESPGLTAAPAIAERVVALLAGF